MTFKQFFLEKENDTAASKFDTLRRRVGANHKLVGDIFGDKIAYTTAGSDDFEVELVLRADEDDDDVVHIENIYANPASRRGGKATAVMQNLMREIDKLDMNAYLEIDPYASENGASQRGKTPPMDVSQLREWYKKFGFTFRSVFDGVDRKPEYSRYGFRPNKKSKETQQGRFLPPLPVGTKLDDDDSFACSSDLMGAYEMSQSSELAKYCTTKFIDGNHYWVPNGAVYTYAGGKLQRHRDTISDWEGNIVEFADY